ncbi:sensor histidine kinase [Paraflavitalea sp. CAU 1676]|uniref:sensor histidine kinase n=1 Tax=Paraflavitalea sp. CAU 1676 TaxID=3032598 RepID=UPI0023D986E8|nr:sensor histidine kinase [Paraflavitalea sp. CAU 1676]MDF2193017.1 sensor histidine kinase [Paraflavitalea sp. CAU 1676]
MLKRLPPGLRQLNTFPFYYEVSVWLICVCTYKYSYLLDVSDLPNPQFDNFPHPQLILFAIGLSLYTIPFYRWLVPTLLKKKKNGWLPVAIILYFGLVCKVSNWIVSNIFYYLTPASPLKDFYAKCVTLTTGLLRRPFGWTPNTLFADIIVFLSVAFIWYAFENERKKHLLEKDNLVLQLDALKAQLHPHFLFNTLNNIYGMSLTGNKETPSFILRLSDMMRFILYDCQRNLVSLEKDLEFLENYLEMEKQRYPAANIQFTISGEALGKQIAPLLFIQFVENSFKHGAHRLNDTGFIHGSLRVEGNSLHFVLRNDVFAIATPASASPYGGVGIENVRKRLALYYPHQHTLSINKTHEVFEVQLSITALSS